MESEKVLGSFVCGSVLLAALALACGCTRTKESITYLGPIDKSTQILAGQEKGLEVIMDNPRGRQLTYKWSSSKPGGKVFHGSDARAVTYQAPAVPGTDTVTVEVLAGNILLDTRSIEMHVVEPDEPVSAKPTAIEDRPPVTPVEGALRITSIEPKPEQCSPSSECLVTVSGTWPRIPGKSLVLVVRPEPSSANQSWWVQARPAFERNREWSVSPVVIGRPGDRAGMPFRLCAVVASSQLDVGQAVGEPPSGPRHCVDVRRGSR